MDLSMTDVARVAGIRELELVLTGSSTNLISLHGEYEGTGDFFSISFWDIEYIEIAGLFVLGGVREGSCEAFSQMKLKWARLRSDYSGKAVAFWSADAASLETAMDNECFLIVCNRLSVTPGSDWEELRLLSL